MIDDLAAMRMEYARVGLDESDLPADWLAQFSRWWADATMAGLPEPNAMIVATTEVINGVGRPSARTVLLKGIDHRGFVFFTNYGSRKATEAAANPFASLVFPWHAIGRQVIVGGGVERVDRAESEDYFAARPRPSQLGAWASPQSQPVAGRGELDQALVEAEARFGADDPVPTPPHWGGLRVVPETVEFWQGRTGRLHDRLRYRRSAPPGPHPATPEESFVIERLGP